MYPFLKKLFADGDYQGPEFHTALTKLLPQLETEIIKRSDHAAVSEAAGAPDYEGVSWHMLLMPSKTPRPIAERLHTEMKRIMAAPRPSASSRTTRRRSRRCAATSRPST